MASTQSQRGSLSTDGLVDTTYRHYHEPELHTQNPNPALPLGEIFRRLTATAAGIDINHPDPDTVPDGWLLAPSTIFKIDAERKFLEPFEYSGHKISVPHLVYALLTYGFQPDVLALELLKKALKHRKVRDLMRTFFRMRGRPVDDCDLQLQLKQNYNWEEVVERLFGEASFRKELGRWAGRYFAGLLVPDAYYTTMSGGCSKRDAVKQWYWNGK
ncbi:hypothetical protein ABW20_dc0100091 [Dactylellina cionopaga]|nr:hypothetical protein ABW20_dc0100091 [Dactylellina cionopaga]